MSKLNRVYLIIKLNQFLYKIIFLSFKWVTLTTFFPTFKDSSFLPSNEELVSHFLKLNNLKLNILYFILIYISNFFIYFLIVMNI